MKLEFPSLNIQDAMLVVILATANPEPQVLGLYFQMRALRDSLGFWVLPPKHLTKSFGLDKSLKIGLWRRILVATNWSCVCAAPLS